jgi:PAS domain S-box-containing protein/diguanylate cyclase (GGDEF)-like protein
VASLDDELKIASVVCGLKDGEQIDNFNYPLNGSPCQDVYSNGPCLIVADICSLYPDDTLLSELGVMAYLGQPLRNNDTGDVIGILVALYCAELKQKENVSLVFDAYAGHVEADICRRHAIDELSHLTQQIFYKNQLLNEIEAISHTGGWEYEINSNNLIWTDETYRIHGIDPSKPESISLSKGFEHYPPESRGVIGDAFYNACEHGLPYKLELKFIDVQGNQKWVLSSARIRRDSAGNITHVYGAIEDITATKELIDTEKERAHFLATTLNSLNDAVVTIDSDGRILSVNDTIDNLLAYGPEELIGQNVAILMPEPYCSMHSQYMSSYLTTGNAKVIGISRELTAQKKNGEIVPIELSISEANQHGKVIFIGIIRDISERKKAEQALEKLAYFDDVTSQPNMHSFERDMRQLLTRAKLTNGQIYVAVIDINRFSEINLAYGARTGDEVLSDCSKRISEQLAQNCLLYRSQGDTFFVVYNLPITDYSQKLEQDFHHQELAIQTAISLDLFIQTNLHNLNASIGSILIESKKTSYESMLSLLEYSRKEVKTKGENALIRLTKDDYKAFDRLKNIKRSIPDALKISQFYIVLQPKFDTNNNIVSSEILIRWQHQELGNISPGEFISIAEQSDDIINISRWVFVQACRIIRDTNILGFDTKLAINISGKDIIRPDFQQTLIDTMNIYGVEPRSFILEITETILVNDINLVKQKIVSLTQKGFQFSIDDFGTGYSSLAYLQSLPIHELKIDKYFVSQITQKNKASPIIDSIITLASAMGLSTVAEGIETQLQLDYLKAKNCDLYQGFYLSKPISEQDWLNTLMQKTNNEMVEEKICTNRI